MLERYLSISSSDEIIVTGLFPKASTVTLITVFIAVLVREVVRLKMMT
jgi:hypothetical protein